ncbi:Metallo-peptidase family M12B Reprolysin-like-domain-containing protein [Gaertneriomyces semiglobifer]|nr:Metallo-peptidase family M12B Reprolysin-like-domain-containing protein [Gaertneriomyces semiglobifer]
MFRRCPHWSSLQLWIVFFITTALAHTQDTAVPPVRLYDFVDKISVKRRFEQISLSFRAIDQTYNLDLTPNLDLLHPQAVVKAHTGSAEPTISSLSAYAYKGDVVFTNTEGIKNKVGWARVLFHAKPSTAHSEHVFEGAFTIDNELYHIREIDAYKRAKRSVDIEVLAASSRPSSHRASRMIVFRDADTTGSAISMLPSDFQLNSMLTTRAEAPIGHCSFDPRDHYQARNAYHDKLERRAAGLVARAPSGCPSSRRVLFMGTAADCTYVSAAGGKENALKQILNNWNTASAVYEETFNVSLGLIDVLLQETCTPNDEALKWNRECSDAYTINKRLSDFSEWRGNKEKDEAGLWHLMTRCSTGSSVGVAWLGMLCAQDAFTQQSPLGPQFVSGTGVSAAVPAEWKVVAHEIGHNFGANHDCSGLTGQCPCSDPEICECCPCGAACDCKGQFLMHPTDSATSRAFSPCTIDQICGGMPKLGSCLKEPGALQTITSGICGNGIREGSEECDCGSEAGCAADPCCGADCKLKNGAKCSDKNDLCCANCQLKSNGTACRPSSGVCDVAEICDGVNPSCPIDVFADNGMPCTVDGVDAQCATGKCTSRDLQCRNQGSLGLRQTCSQRNTGCQMFCENGAGQCLMLNSYFVDGTPCGISGKGYCNAGNCKSGNILDTAAGWIADNKQIAIPILVVGGLLLIFLLSSLIRCLCCGSSSKPKWARRPTRTSDASTRALHPAPLDPTWVDPTPYNGRS